MADGAARTGLWARIVGYFSRPSRNPRGARWQAWLIVSLFAALFLLVVHCLAAAGYPNGLKVAAAAILVAGGAGFVGLLIGFLFGIPRSLQRDSIESDKNAAEPFQSVKVNTNLEQISDWLTKIFVGVGLTQAKTIFDGVYAFAKKISGLVTFPAAGTVTAEEGTGLVLVIIVLFSIQGFLQGYLWARIYLQQDFNELEQKAKRKPAYYEGLMNSYLYMDQPKSFQEALKLHEQYKEASGDDLTPRMATYLVCALGQQYAWKMNVEGKKEADLKKEKAELIEVLKRALRDDKEAHSILKLQLEPETAGDAVDDELFDGDLCAFRTDEDVRRLLRMPKPKV
jgi:hypothetical protein